YALLPMIVVPLLYCKRQSPIKFSDNEFNKKHPSSDRKRERRHNANNWQGAVGSAILSHLGFHAPLLLTDNSQKLPSSLGGYFQSVAPTFLVSPADGPYNMTYVIGNYNQVSWPEQSMIDYLSGMANRHVWSQNTGSVYIAPR
ncbi:MAG: hypothetical protein ACYCYO_22210, partial [Bacilli bacterium]